MIQDFRWSVAKDYEWREVRATGHLRLHGDVQAVLVPVGGTRGDYRPLIDTPRLFREFAGLVGGHAAFRDFARAHGSLGLAAFPDDGMAAVRGELANDLPGFQSWSSVWGDLQRALWRWDILRGRSGLDEREVIHLFVPRHDGDDAKPIPTRAEQRRRFVTNELQQQLAAAVASGLQAQAVTPALEVSGGGFSLDYTPRTLAGALWLQLAWAISGRADIAQCVNCQKWLRSPGRKKIRRHRTDARFCSDLCRATWHQAQRKAKKHADKLSG